jgi:Asp-tRNA(Asn)/Glu-tRNA(Gln) amidotransferase A subunit family amidase
MKKLNELGAREAAKRLASRDIAAEALARACLERIAEREATVGAWIYLDPDAALAQAKKLDAVPVRWPLHGLPLRREGHHRHRRHAHGLRRSRPRGHAHQVG